MLCAWVVCLSSTEQNNYNPGQERQTTKFSNLPSARWEVKTAKTNITHHLLPQWAKRLPSRNEQPQVYGGLPQYATVEYSLVINGTIQPWLRRRWLRTGEHCPNSAEHEDKCIPFLRHSHWEWPQFLLTMERWSGSIHNLWGKLWPVLAKKKGPSWDPVRCFSPSCGKVLLILGSASSMRTVNKSSGNAIFTAPKRWKI